MHSRQDTNQFRHSVYSSVGSSTAAQNYRPSPPKENAEHARQMPFHAEAGPIAGPLHAEGSGQHVSSGAHSSTGKQVSDEPSSHVRLQMFAKQSVQWLHKQVRREDMTTS